jgi:hypothetical protein
MSGPPRGSSVIEALVALLLTTGLLIGVGALLVQHQRTARALAVRVEAIEAARLARDLLSMALASDPAARVGEAGLLVRTVVGVGERCDEEGWEYTGRRLPDPARDSLWIVTGAGRIRVMKLRSRGEADCGDGRDVRGMVLEADSALPADARVVRVFESGRFRVDDAVRYGRLGSGAEPLSAAVLDPARSSIQEVEDGIAVVIHPEGRSPGFRGVWGR